MNKTFSLSLSLLVLLILSFLAFGVVFAATQGYNSPQTVVNDNSNGAYDAWSNPGNATASDDSRATVLLDGTFSQYLKATNFGFLIPIGSIIDGIWVFAEVSNAGDGPGFIVDRAARIIKGGVIGSADRSSVGHWPTTIYEDYLSHGNNTDKWGTYWGPTDINASNFGFALSADHSNASLTARVDHIRIIVYYSSPYSAGPNNPGTMANDNSYGARAWSDVDNAKVSGDLRATNVGIQAVATNYLKATNFGFGLPSTADVTGIEVNVERLCTGGDCSSDRARIVKGGAVGSTNQYLSWPPTESIQTLGSSNDKWGETWTYGDINASNFGFVVSGFDVGGEGVSTFAVDHITITVYYAD